MKPRGFPKMNKYLLMSAAAAFAATTTGGVAQAATVHLGTSGTGSYCDYFIITNNAGGLVAGKHVGGLSCGSSVFNDPAYKAGKGAAPFGVKTHTLGFADTVFALAGLSYDGLDFVFSTPLNPDSGGVWAILANTTGNTTYILNHGVTTSKVKPGAHHESSVAHAIAALKITKK